MRDAYFPKYLDCTILLPLINAFLNSDWYQQKNRAGPQYNAIQHHMVTWSVDTLPQLFEVTTFTHLRQSTQPHMDWITFVSDGFCLVHANYDKCLHNPWSLVNWPFGHCTMHIPYIQGGRLQSRCAGVPRCQRRLPQGELQ